MKKFNKVSESRNQSAINDWLSAFRDSARAYDTGMQFRIDRNTIFVDFDDDKQYMDNRRGDSMIQVLSEEDNWGSAYAEIVNMNDSYKRQVLKELDSDVFLESQTNPKFVFFDIVDIINVLQKITKSSMKQYR